MARVLLTATEAAAAATATATTSSSNTTRTDAPTSASDSAACDPHQLEQEEPSTSPSPPPPPPPPPPFDEEEPHEQQPQVVVVDAYVLTTIAGTATTAAEDAFDLSSSLLAQHLSTSQYHQLRIRIVALSHRLNAVAAIHQQSKLPMGSAIVKVLLDTVVSDVAAFLIEQQEEEDPVVGNSTNDRSPTCYSRHRQLIETTAVELERVYYSMNDNEAVVTAAIGGSRSNQVTALLEGLYEQLLLAAPLFTPSSSTNAPVNEVSGTGSTRQHQHRHRRQRPRLLLSSQRIVRDAVWPMALPPLLCDGEPDNIGPVVLSVSCGNTSYTWALHERSGSAAAAAMGTGRDDSSSSGSAPMKDDGMDDVWAVKTTWKTSALTPEMCRDRHDDPSTMLEAFLPPPVLEHFFGSDIFVTPHAVPSDNDHDNTENPTNVPPPDMDDPQYRHSRMTVQRMWQTALTHRRHYPVMYVYVISTNQSHELGIEYLLQDAPVILWRLVNTDFFSPDNGCYPTLGVDRAAAALAAVSITGVPALVVDGGTAMTYTAVDASGKLLGGGITPGINLKLQSLAKGTGALPYLTVPTVLERIQNCQQTNVPIPFASNNTPDAILSGVLRETTAYTCSVIDAWRTTCGTLPDVNEATGVDVASAAAAPEVGDADAASAMDVDGTIDSRNEGGTSDSDTNQPQPSINHKMRFLVTGGDAPLLRSLLSPNHSYIIDLLPHYPPHGYSGSIALTEHDHLVHYGISHVLQRQQRELRDGSEVESTAPDAAGSPPSLDEALERSRMKLMGLRVARRAVTRDDNPSNSAPLCVRGTVVGAVRRGSALDQDLFMVLYDDQATELVTVIELHDSLMDYYQQGEAWLTQLRFKQDASLRGAQLLLDGCPNLAAHLSLLRPSGLRPMGVIVPKRLTMADLFPASDVQVGGGNGAPSAMAAERSPASTIAQGAPAPDPMLKIPSAKSVHMNPHSVVGRRCCKRFEGDPSKLYFGSIVTHRSADETGGAGAMSPSERPPHEEDPGDIEVDQDGDDGVDDNYAMLWRIEYDDGDSEDWDVESVVHGLALYRRHRQHDPQKLDEAEAVAAAASSAAACSNHKDDTTSDAREDDSHA